MFLDGIVGKDVVNSVNNMLAQKKEMEGYKDSSGFGRNEMGLLFDPTSSDSYVDAMNQMAAWKRDDSYFQRAFADLQKVGINPAVLLSSGGFQGINSASTFKTSSAEDVRHKRNSEKLSMVANSAKVIGAVVAAIAAVAALA